MIETMKPNMVNALKQIIYKELLDDENVNLKDIPNEKIGYILDSAIESTFDFLMAYYGDEPRTLEDERMVERGSFSKTQKDGIDNLKKEMEKILNESRKRNMESTI